MLPMVNEAIAILRERVVADAEPRRRRRRVRSRLRAVSRRTAARYAGERGVAKVLARLAELEARHGERFRPDAGWSTFGAGGV